MSTFRLAYLYDVLRGDVGVKVVMVTPVALYRAMPALLRMQECLP